jgi:hypothetical protein
MTTQHTPGPWEVGYCTWNDDDNVCYELKGIKRASALDARLISAAPDLLEALKRVMPFIDCIAAVTREEIIEYESAMKMADAAIKKATGQE